MVDTILDCGETPERGTSLAAAIAAAFRRFARLRRARRALRDISSLPDALLKDIGVTRGGLEGAVLCGRQDIEIRLTPKEPDSERTDP